MTKVSAFELQDVGAKSVYARDVKHRDELIAREFKPGAKVEISRFIQDRAAFAHDLDI